jgi:hypothetical protein
MPFKFEKTGSYYHKNSLFKCCLMIKRGFIAVKMFAMCLLDYKESIIGNDFSLSECWDLCLAQGDMETGRTYTMWEN